MRNNSVQSTRNFRGGVTVPMTATYGEAITDVIRREFGPLRHAAKLLARITGSSHRTAENWLAGLNASSGENLIALMAESDALNEEVARLVAERKAARGAK